jgi:hypothetical protein
MTPCLLNFEASSQPYPRKGWRYLLRRARRTACKKTSRDLSGPSPLPRTESILAADLHGPTRPRIPKANIFPLQEVEMLFVTGISLAAWVGLQPN